MINIAIVEDEIEDRERLHSYIERYEKEKGNLKFDIKEFSNPSEFLKDYSCEYNLVFLDIKMPGMTGLELAKLIREKDAEVIIFFITSLAQYAIKGYEVNALDFVVKPIQYPEFVLKFSKAISRIDLSDEKTILISFNRSTMKIYLKDIEYIEAFGHSIIYHIDGNEYKSQGTLKTAEKEINNDSFVRCNSGYLVNLKHIKKIDDEYCYVGNDKLIISRPKKKAFKDAFLNYLQGN